MPRVGGKRNREQPSSEKVVGGGGKRGRVDDIIYGASRVGSDTDSDDTSEDPPHTPFNNPPPPTNTAQQTPLTIGFQRGPSPPVQGNGNAIAVKVGDCEEKDKSNEREITFEGFNVDLEVKNELEYVLRIKRKKIECSTDDDIEKGAKKMAQSAGTLLGLAKMLKEKGKKQLDQYLETLRHITDKSTAPRNLSFSFDDLD